MSGVRGDLGDHADDRLAEGTRRAAAHDRGVGVIGGRDDALVAAQAARYSAGKRRPRSAGRRSACRLGRWQPEVSVLPGCPT